MSGSAYCSRADSPRFRFAAHGNGFLSGGTGEISDRDGLVNVVRTVFGPGCRSRPQGYGAMAFRIGAGAQGYAIFVVGVHDGVRISVRARAIGVSHADSDASRSFRFRMVADGEAAFAGGFYDGSYRGGVDPGSRIIVEVHSIGRIDVEIMGFRLIDYVVQLFHIDGVRSRRTGRDIADCGGIPPVIQCNFRFRRIVVNNRIGRQHGRLSACQCRFQSALYRSIARPVNR